MTPRFEHYLTPFLAALRSPERQLTLEDYRRIHRVLSTQGQWTHQRLQQVLAALLTHSAQQQSEFNHEYQQFFGTDALRPAIIPEIDMQAMRQELAILSEYQLDQATVDDWHTVAEHKPSRPLSSVTPEKPGWFDDLRKVVRQKKLLSPLIGLLCGLLLLLSFGLYPFIKTDTPAPESLTPEVTQAETVDGIKTTTDKITIEPGAKPDVAPPQPAREIDWSFLWWWLLPLLGLVVTAYAFQRRRALEKVPEAMVTLERPPNDAPQPQEAIATTLAQEGNWLDSDTLDYCADSVGFFLSEAPSQALDVAATVDATLKAGGVPSLRLQQQRELFHLLILVDLDNESVYWNQLPQELVSGLRRRGVPVSLGYFQGSLAQINLDSGRSITLAEISEQRDCYSVLLFADATLLGSPDYRVALDELAGWPQFAWLSLREQRHWSGAEEYVRQSGIALWEAKPACLPAVFRYLAGEMLHTRSMGLPEWPFQEQQLHKQEEIEAYLVRYLADVLPLARIVALLPPPVSPAFLIRIVREFAPGVSLFRMQRLFTLPGEVQGVGGVFWSMPVLKQLRAEFHRLHDDVEKRRVLTTLLDWLKELEPEDKAGTAWLEWRFRYARLLGELDADAAWAIMAELEASGLPVERFAGLAEDVLPMPEPQSAKSLQTACQFGRRHGMPTVSLEKAFPEWFFWRRLVPVGAVLSLLLFCWACYPTVQALLPAEEPEKEVLAQDDATQSTPTAVESPAPVVTDTTASEAPLTVTLPEMVTIPGGTFTMGCVAGRDDMISSGCLDSEKPEHEVTIADFELSTHEVTVGQFRDFVSATAYRTTAEQAGSCWSYDAKGSFDDVKGNNWREPGYEQTDEHPVSCVSWLDAKAYTTWLNQHSKEDNKGEWRLPTEAEWEYAARGGAGRKSSYSWGNQEPVCDLTAVNGAQFGSCEESRPIAVGSFKQNAHPFGLFDMHGNVWEWVEDCWQNNYNGVPDNGTALASCDADASRVLRGGSWNNTPRALRSANRFNDIPSLRSANVGFRAARTRFTLPSKSSGAVEQVAEEAKQTGTPAQQAAESSSPPVAADAIQLLAPKMVKIPGGRFQMGCDPKRDDVEGGCFDSEKPLHEVTVPAFWLSETEVTVGQFRAFVTASGYKTDAERKGSCYGDKNGKGDWGDVDGNFWDKPGFEQTDSHPVTCISWNDAKKYVGWLSEQTDKNYRLPTESEWEYAARAETETAYSWGMKAADGCAFANMADQKAKAVYSNWTIADCDDGYVYTSSVGSFASNAFGLKDMHGNVWEWVEDCWQGDYEGAADDGSAKLGCDADASRVLRGGSWGFKPGLLRSASRDLDNPSNRLSAVGFRAARTN